MTASNTSVNGPESQEPPPGRSAAPIIAVPVRFPERWVAAGAVLILAAMFVNMLLTNPAFNWPFMFEHMFSDQVVRGVWVTLSATVLSMIIGILLGIVLAVMRLSGNPVLVTVSWLYTWFFRGYLAWCWPCSSATSPSCTRPSSSDFRSTTTGCL